MTRFRTIIIAALLLIGTTASLAADGAKGSFRLGKVVFEPADAFAYQEPAGDPAKPLTVAALTNFKIDRGAVLDAINTAA
jgi:hypothetical protein